MDGELSAQREFQRFATPTPALIVVNTIGMIGYEIIGGPQASWLDSLHMTFNTIATIGYGEIVDLVAIPPAGACPPWPSS